MEIYNIMKLGLISWNAYGPCLVWEKVDYDEDKRGL